MTDMFHKYW